MPVCKVGCDDFFEKGYLIVNQNGVIQSNKDKKVSDDLELVLHDVIGNQCTHFNQETEEFFSYRRDSFEQD